MLVLLICFALQLSHAAEDGKARGHYWRGSDECMRWFPSVPTWRPRCVIMLLRSVARVLRSAAAGPCRVLHSALVGRRHAGRTTTKPRLQCDSAYN